MSGTTLYARVTTADGQVLVEQQLDTGDGHARVESLANLAAYIAMDARGNGHDVQLWVMDPDGDTTPAGEWMLVGELPAIDKGEPT